MDEKFIFEIDTIECIKTKIIHIQAKVTLTNIDHLVLLSRLTCISF